MTFERFVVVGAWLAAGVLLAAMCLAEPSWSPYLTLLGVVVTCAVVARHQRQSLGSITVASVPRTWFAGVVGLVVGASLIAAVMRVPGILSAGYKRLSAPTYSLSAADIEPLGISGSVDAIAAAARTIPVTSSYSVVGAPDKYDTWAIYRFWLAPRRFTPDYRASAWVVVYGPVPRGLKVDRRMRLAPGIDALEVGS